MFKKITLLLITILLMASVCFSANTRTSANTSTGRYEAASVDTDPGATGYGCNGVSIQKKRGMGYEEIWYYVKTVGTDATITLQWSTDDSTYYDIPSGDYTVEAGARRIIHDNSAGVYYRLWVKDNEQGSSGASLFGISW